MRGVPACWHADTQLMRVLVGMVIYVSAGAARGNSSCVTCFTVCLHADVT